MDGLDIFWFVTGLIKFFGNVAYIHPKEICDRFHGFAIMIFKLVEGADPSLCPVAMETIGFIGSTPEGKLALQKQGEISVLWWSVFVRHKNY